MSIVDRYNWNGPCDTCEQKPDYPRCTGSRCHRYYINLTNRRDQILRDFVDSALYFELGKTIKIGLPFFPHSDKQIWRIKLTVCTECFDNAMFTYTEHDPVNEKGTIEKRRFNKKAEK